MSNVTQPTYSNQYPTQQGYPTREFQRQQYHAQYPMQNLQQIYNRQQERPQSSPYPIEPGTSNPSNFDFNHNPNPQPKPIQLKIM